MATKEDLILEKIEQCRKDIADLRRELWGLKPKIYASYVLVAALAAKVFGVKFF